MNQLTNQEILDKSYAFIVAQGKPGARDRSNCAYLTDDGRRCAVGCFFKNDEETNARAREQGGTAIGLFQRGVLHTYLDFDLQEGQEQLLSELQLAHDYAKCEAEAEVARARGVPIRDVDILDPEVGATFIQHFKKKITETAATFKLVSPVNEV